MPKVRNHFPDFKGQKNAVSKIANSFAKVAGTEAVRHFRQSFRRGGFIDRKFERWKARKPQKKDRGKKNRALMVQSGDLRRSIRILHKGAKWVIVGTDVKYAAIHNEGGVIQHPGGTPYIILHKKGQKEAAFISKKEAAELRDEGIRTFNTNPHPIPMPKRKFVGKSYVLEYRIRRWLTEQLKMAIQ